jgi:mono/diheme cytochrome c family protein
MSAGTNRNVKSVTKIIWVVVFVLCLMQAKAFAEPASGPAAIGRSLFLKNCAHCHADDAKGDEGPDLHDLEKSDDWIARRIRNGVKGEMTAFGGKFSQKDIDALIAYLRTLK